MTLAIQFVYVFLMAVVLALIGQRFCKNTRPEPATVMQLMPE
jgi:hypothetical protein